MPSYRPTKSWTERLVGLLEGLVDSRTGALTVRQRTASTEQVLGEGALDEITRSAVIQKDMLSLLLAEQRKTNFLLERISGVDIEAEIFHEN